ncbi:VanZ family protein, partial [Streptomyces sp. NPDC059556]
MTPSAPLPTPPRRTRRTVLTCLAVLGLAGALYAVRGPLMMSAPRCMAGRWHGCFDTFNGVVLMTLVAVPLSLLVAGAMALRRRAAGRAPAWRMSLAEVGMVHGTVPFLWLTLMAGAAPGIAPARVSLVPVRVLVTMGTLGIVGKLL